MQSEVALGDATRRDAQSKRLRPQPIGCPPKPPLKLCARREAYGYHRPSVVPSTPRRKEKPTIVSMKEKDSILGLAPKKFACAVAYCLHP